MVLATRGSSAIVVLGLMAKCRLWPFNTDLDLICRYGISGRGSYPSYEGISSVELYME